MTNESLSYILTGSGSEFFASQGRAFVTHKRMILTMDEAPREITGPLYKFMSSNPERLNAYKEMAGENVIDQMNQCVKCMFANLDGVPDIDVNGKITNTEFVSCSKRGECKFEGVGCNLLTSINGSKISKSEIRVLQLAHLEEKEIAEKLYLSPQTVHRHSQNIRIKTGIRTGKEMAVWAYGKGIINQSQLCVY